MTNCTSTQNTGGYRAVYNGGTITLTNVILFNDTSVNNVEIDGNAATASFCDIAQTSGIYAGTGNLNANPLFVNAPADLHLQSGSPCLNAGTASGAPTTDITGHTRPNPPSIGAYEGPSQTATTLAVSNASGADGQTIHLVGRLRRSDNPKGYLPGEIVSFQIDGMAAPSTTGKIVTDSNGFAVDYYLAPGTLTAGTHTLSAAFAGDSAYAASNGTAVLSITTAATSLAVAPVSGAAGQTVSLMVTLTSGAGGVGGKTLSFQVDGAAAGTAVTGTNGAATYAYVIPSGTALGSHTITVSFTGDGGYTASTGTGTLTVTLVPTTLTVSNASGADGQTIHLVGRLRRSDNPKGYLPGEIVSFQIDGMAAPSTTGKIVTDSNGFAVDYYLASGTLTAGTHTLSAAFAGDSAYAASNGTAVLTIMH